MSTLERAIAIAAEAHAGQLDKAVATEHDFPRIEKYHAAIALMGDGATAGLEHAR